MAIHHEQGVVKNIQITSAMVCVFLILDHKVHAFQTQGYGWDAHQAIQQPMEMWMFQPVQLLLSPGLHIGDDALTTIWICGCDFQEVFQNAGGDPGEVTTKQCCQNLCNCCFHHLPFASLCRQLLVVDGLVTHHDVQDPLVSGVRNESAHHIWSHRLSWSHVDSGSSRLEILHQNVMLQFFYLHLSTSAEDGVSPTTGALRRNDYRLLFDGLSLGSLEAKSVLKAGDALSHALSTSLVPPLNHEGHTLQVAIVGDVHLGLLWRTLRRSPMDVYQLRRGKLVSLRSFLLHFDRVSISRCNRSSRLYLGLRLAGWRCRPLCLGLRRWRLRQRASTWRWRRPWCLSRSFRLRKSFRRCGAAECCDILGSFAW
mmetsp:Transcript_35806/g.64985  ORF Transcript_35806/g.64985 Transcript_35806/m.64985 type:complete len:369 (+) Transcript_35806:1909-3015(+)